MKYVEFKVRVRRALQDNPDGLTWQDLKSTLNLSYKMPCQTWVYKLENEIQLVRSKGEGKGGAYIWKIDE